MNRRQFIKKGLQAGSAVLLAPQLIGCHRKPPSESERELLTDFLKFSDESYLTKANIENTLYEISEIYDGDDTATRGRATHLGDNYFLTAYHVVNEGTSNLRLIPQWRREYLLDFRQGFEIVEYDEKSDLALLKTSDRDNKRKATLHLSSTIPSLDDNISTFIRLTGNPPKERYEFEYGGRDFYDESIEIANLGKLILPAQSLLFEKRGRVLKYDEKYLNQVFGSHKGTSENEIFTSVASYNGESGQPMFVKVSEDKYVFVGILTAAYGIKHGIPTPNHPLGYESIQQTGAFFAHRNPIEKLVKRHL